MKILLKIIYGILSTEVNMMDEDQFFEQFKNTDHDSIIRFMKLQNRQIKLYKKLNEFKKRC